ncbi:hypothetical protein GKO32_35080 [Amycolatopsis sp. RM579]|uniref:Subtilisin inhibitor domain-containing protein n=2 Tax=Amycolatopsis pithecellobii TaxID=664692 RepID=A0A6N7ZBM6_9PSEU|nr:hypothetical protein [Amycolatopsis pithecellobii]
MCAGIAGAMVTWAPAASAAGAEPALVHASPVNDCKLNVRTGADAGATLLTTLTCVNYTTCASASDVPCGPYVTGGVYSCVGADGKELTDNRWAEVSWRVPQKSYVAVGCAAFRP